MAVAYTTGRASRARQVKGDDPHKNRYPGPPGWGLGVRLPTSPRKNNTVTKPQGNEAERIPGQRQEAVHEGHRLRTRNKLELNIDTWNVRSLYRAGALKTLINQLSA
jgi:hypothetical protein